MIPFDLAEPTSLSAAIKLLNPDDPTIRPIAGGTALMLMMKAGVYNPEKLISLRKIESKYSNVSAGSDGLRIGAMTTLGTLERSSDVKKHTPLISRTLTTLSNIRVRNVATVGGALAHGDPHMDLPPVLMALGTTLTVIGVTGVEVNLQLARIAEIRLGSVILRDVPIAFAEVPPFAVFGLSNEPALLLGTDLMETFRRVSLDLGPPRPNDLPTDNRVLASKEHPDPALAALFFQYGRYLLIASSRPGDQPANLQGNWNDELAPPWESITTRAS